MANMEGIKIHTMQDDLTSARSSVNASHKKSQPPNKPTNQPKLFPVPSRPTNNGNLVLPRRHVPRSLGEGGSLGRRQAYWFIIGAAVLVVLNIIIWGIALTG